MGTKMTTGSWSIRNTCTFRVLNRKLACPLKRLYSLFFYKHILSEGTMEEHPWREFFVHLLPRLRMNIFSFRIFRPYCSLVFHFWFRKHSIYRYPHISLSYRPRCSVFQARIGHCLKEYFFHTKSFNCTSKMWPYCEKRFNHFSSFQYGL